MFEGLWELEGEGELVAGRWQGGDEVSDDLVAVFRVGGEHAVVASEVEVGGAESELRLRVDHMDVDLECGGVCADVTARF